MATVSYKICDRCKQPINEHSRRLSKIRKAKVKSAFLGTVDEREYELCGECSEELDNFLYPTVKKQEV